MLVQSSGHDWPRGRRTSASPRWPRQGHTSPGSESGPSHLLREPSPLRWSQAINRCCRMSAGSSGVRDEVRELTPFPRVVHNRALRSDDNREWGVEVGTEMFDWPVPGDDELGEGVRDSLPAMPGGLDSGTGACLAQLHLPFQAMEPARNPAGFNCFLRSDFACEAGQVDTSRSTGCHPDGLGWPTPCPLEGHVVVEG